MDGGNKPRVWGIHTRDEPLFLQEDVIAIGWFEMGDLSGLGDDRDSFRKRYAEAYPDAKKYSAALGAGMLFRFVHEMRVGDYVVFPSRNDRRINIGVVESGYEYVPDRPMYVQQRRVKWLKHVPRTAFSQGALYEIGSAMSFFSVRNYADEFLSALDKGFRKASRPAMTRPSERRQTRS